MNSLPALKSWVLSSCLTTMKIGIDGRFWHSSNAGLSQHTKGIVKALVQLDKKNDYVVFLRKQDLAEWDIKATNFKIEVADIEHFSWREQVILPWKFLKSKLDLMYFPNFNHSVFYPGKFIITVHDLAYLTFPGKRLKGGIFKIGYQLALRLGTKRAFKILTDTKQGKEECLIKLGASKEKVAIIPLAVDKSRLITDKNEISQLKQKLKLSSPVIFYVGGWRVHKNIQTLLTAFKIIHQDLGEAQLLLGGTPNNDIMGLIEEHPYKNDIIVSGFIPEKQLANYYSLADVFVFPSFYEGFGLPVLEAQHLGIPVATSNVSTLPEVGGQGAMYFNPNDSQDMASVIINILKDKKLQDKLVSKGRENIKSYSWEAAAKKLQTIFMEVKK